MAGDDGLEIERKYLVRLVGDPRSAPGARSLALRQVYLLDEGAAARRIRATTVDGRTVHHLTVKEPIAPGVRREDEREIDATAFAALEAQADPARRAVVKELIAVPHAGRTWEIDIFAGALAGLVLAEVELGSVAELDERLEPPACIAVVRDVTDDDDYGNAHLARLDAPPAAG